MHSFSSHFILNRISKNVGIAQRRALSEAACFSRAKRRSVAIHGRCRRCRWEVATSILLPAPSPLPAFCASPRALRGSQFSPFPVRKPFLYVRSRGVALGEQRWRRRGAPIRTRGAVQRSRVRWERGDNGATCTAHRPWPAKHAASSPHPPSVRSPECFIRGTVRTPARPPAACPTLRRTRRMILWMWLRRRRR